MNEREYLENFERTQIRVVTTLLKATENVDAIKTSEKMIAQGHAKRVLSLFGNVLENRYWKTASIVFRNKISSRTVVTK